MLQNADLHVHTTLSDGTFSPREVMAYASQIGLDCIAICDHDVVAGIKSAVEVSEKYRVEVVPGIEMTAEKQGREVHILGFFVDWQDQAFIERLQQLCQQRKQRIYEMVDRLKKFGIRLNSIDVFRASGAGSVGRLHLATVMQKKGHVRTIREAFTKYIGDGKPCYVAKIGLTPEEAIKEIIRAKGIPVLAHPGIMADDEAILEYLEYGLKGIEVYHTDHTRANVRHYETLAEKHNLLVTGGSDCHGLGKGRVLMGSIIVSYRLVEKLKNARR